MNGRGRARRSGRSPSRSRCAIRASWVGFSWNVASTPGSPLSAPWNRKCSPMSVLPAPVGPGDERHRAGPVAVTERFVERRDPGRDALAYRACSSRCRSRRRGEGRRRGRRRPMRYACSPVRKPLPRSLSTCSTRSSRSAVRLACSAMIASATANSGASAAWSRSYSPIQNDDAATAVSRPARSWRKRRNSASSAANDRSALKLSMTTKLGCCSLRSLVDLVDDAGKAVVGRRPRRGRRRRPTFRSRRRRRTSATGRSEGSCRTAPTPSTGRRPGGPRARCGTGTARRGSSCRFPGGR